MTDNIRVPGGTPRIPATSVFTDGETITGNGTEASPLVATASGNATREARTTVDEGEFLPGMVAAPATFGGFHAVQCRADGPSVFHALGICIVGNDEDADQITYQYEGIVTLTAEQWDAVGAGSSGLNPGSVYYVSGNGAGELGFITTSPPSEPPSMVIQVGIALSTTEMQLQLAPPVINVA